MFEKYIKSIKGMSEMMGEGKRKSKIRCMAKK